MIDLLNRIGFKQIAFGGEGGGGGGGARGMPAASNNVVKNAALRKNIMNMPHKLAYITPQEEQMLRDAGGTGQFVNGIPAFPPVSGRTQGRSNTGTGFSGGSRGGGSSSGGSSGGRSNPGDIAGGGYGSGNSGGNAGSRPSSDFGSSNDDNDNDPPPVVYTPPPVVYTPPPVVYTPPDPVYTTPDPVTVSPTDTSNVYDFYEPDPVTVSPTDTSNVYDFYEPDPVTVYGGGSNDEETVMSQPVTYTGPAVETTLDTDPVVDFSLDDLDLGTGVAPVDETPISVFDANMLSQITNIRAFPPPQTNWVGNTTQEAINLNQNNRFDFDPVNAYETETTGALPSSDIVAGGLGVSPVPRPRPDNLIMGRPPIGPTVTVSTSNALTTPQTFGALPDGVTQQMITDSQNDGKYGYYYNDGSYVPPEIDKYNGGGPDYGGVRFASGGGAQFDLDGDRFLSKKEMRIGEDAGKELDQNFWSKAGTGLGGTPLGSGEEPTGVAKWGSTLRKLSPPAFERPLSSYDPTNPYADVGEDAPNIWWEKGKKNPLGFEYKRTPAEVLADRTASREKAAIDDLAEHRQNNSDERDNASRTRREDLFGTRMTTEEYRRRYKGGGGAALPAYMRKYASGKSIDELVRKVKVNGKDYFLTPDGRYIEPSAFTGAAASRDIDVVETGEEQYLEGYNVIDESTGIITTYNTDGSIMEVFDPNFESEEA
jgi:hypothetical protein